MQCKHCEYDAETDSEMKTHMLLRHKDEIDSSEYDTPVDKGFFEEPDIPQGDQFGYK